MNYIGQALNITLLWRHKVYFTIGNSMRTEEWTQNIEGLPQVFRFIDGGCVKASFC